MGAVKEAVKGSGPSSSTEKKSPTPTRQDARNLVDRLDSMIGEVAGLASQKDDDLFREGEAAKAENERKATLLRAANTLLRGARRILEDY